MNSHCEHLPSHPRAGAADRLAFQDQELDEVLRTLAVIGALTSALLMAAAAPVAAGVLTAAVWELPWQLTAASCTGVCGVVGVMGLVALKLTAGVRERLSLRP